MIHSSLDQQHLRRGVAHLHSLGQRAELEFLTELSRRIGGGPAIIALLNEFQAVSPGMVRAAGGDRMPPRPLRVVPAP